MSSLIGFKKHILQIQFKGFAMKRLCLILTSLFLFTNIYGQKLETAEKILEVTKSQLQTLSGLPIDFDVHLYKITYHTPDVNGNDHIASGLLCVPQDEALAFPLACYQHGTVAGREDVPSNLAGGYTLPLIFSGLGYVVCAPDFIGLGDSPGVHPYVHAETEASCAVDLMFATRELAADEDFGGFSLNDQVFVSGYSQGGHAAMALHRSLELDYADDFKVTGSAPMSGPYSISEKMSEFTLSDEPYGTVAYLAWVTLGYQAAYPETLGMMTLDEVFKPEYLEDIEAFKNEEINLWELNDRVTNTLVTTVGTVTPKDMLLPNLLNSLLTDPMHPFNVALADNDTYDWSPQAPTRLYYCVGDEQVTYENAILAEEVMKQNGAADIQAVQRDTDSFPLSHGGCVTPAAQALISFFGSLQNLLSNNTEVQSDPNVKIQYYDGQLLLKIPLERKATSNWLTIFNQSGQKVFERQIDKGVTVEDINWLNRGMYFVTLRDNQSLYRNAKIVKY